MTWVGRSRPAEEAPEIVLDALQALLSGYALLALLYTIHVQALESQLQRQELLNHGKELEKSNALSEMSLRISNRAYLTVRKGHQPSLIAGVPLLLRITVQNAGATPAQNVTPDIQYRMVEEGFKGFSYGDFFLDGFHLPPHGFTLAARDELEPRVELENLSQTQVDGLKDGTLHLYLGGYVTYDDIFGDHHETNYCLEYRPRTNDWDFWKGGNSAN
jgi:hypothetical protein